jgi:hypothetical protein
LQSRDTDADDAGQLPGERLLGMPRQSTRRELDAPRTGKCPRKRTRREAIDPTTSSQNYRAHTNINFGK